MVGSEDIRLAVSADAEAITEMLAYLAEDMGDRAAFASTLEAIREFGFGPRPLFSVLIASGAGLCLIFSAFLYDTRMPRGLCAGPMGRPIGM